MIVALRNQVVLWIGGASFFVLITAGIPAGWQNLVALVGRNSAVFWSFGLCSLFAIYAFFMFIYDVQASQKRATDLQNRIRALPVTDEIKN